MDQNFNNDQNNFNNQPINNQDFNQGMGGNPQPVNQMSTQPINTFESDKDNNQDLNSKPPKKMNFGLIIGIVVAIAVIVVGIFFGGKLFSNNHNDDGTKNDSSKTKSVTIKKQEYFNKNQKSENKLAIIFPKNYLNGPNVFIGMNFEGIAEDFYFDTNSNTIRNSHTNYKIIGDTIIEMKYNDYPITISNSTQLKYNGQNLGEYTIVKQQGNYYIVKNPNYDLYYLFLKYNETIYNNETYWQALFFGSKDNLNDLINEISNVENYYSICTYYEDINECKSINSKTVNYKDYRYYGDMILDYLNKNDLYVDSYKLVTITSYSIRVSNNSVISNGGSVVFDIKEVKFGRDKQNNFSMNNKDFYISNHFIGMKKENTSLDIAVTLNFDVEYTEDNCIKEFKNTFENK